MFKDTHRENTPSNKTEMLTKSMNIYIWTIGILNALFTRDSYTQTKFSKKKKKRIIRWQKSIPGDESISHSPFNLS